MYLLTYHAGHQITGTNGGETRPLSFSRERTDVRARRDRIPKALGALDVTLLCHWPVLGVARADWYHSNACTRVRVASAEQSEESRRSGGRPPTRATIPSSARPVQRHLKFRRSEIARIRELKAKPVRIRERRMPPRIDLSILSQEIRIEKERTKVERGSVMQRVRVRCDVMLRCDLNTTPSCQFLM